MESDRHEMLDTIRFRYGLGDENVLSVIGKIRREMFVPKKYRKFSYNDEPVDIGYGQTISQPYTVAFMTQLLLNSKTITKNAKLGNVLEIGTGSGYQAAILSYFFHKVYTVEIIPQLAKRSFKLLRKLGYENVFVRTGSGEYGWVQNAPFDAIMITAGVEKVPKQLFRQLKIDGVLVAPVGVGDEKIMNRFTKLKKSDKEEIIIEEFGGFTFVPFVSNFDNVKT